MSTKTQILRGFTLRGLLIATAILVIQLVIVSDKRIASTMIFLDWEKPLAQSQSSNVTAVGQDAFHGTPTNSQLLVDPIEAALRRKKEQKLHVLWGLSGNRSSFIDEFDVSLKSVLLNAPLDADMDIHLVVDEAAYLAVHRSILVPHGLEGSLWRRSIAMHFYVVPDAVKIRYKERVSSSLPYRGIQPGERVGVGGLFRLFAYEILPKGTGPVLYLDNDVIILSNLNEINTIIDSQYMYQVGHAKDVCSGLMILNLDQFHRFWPELGKLPFRKMPWNDKIGDQKLLALVREQNSSLVGDLPLEWHVHLAHGFRYKAPHTLYTNRSKVAMMHFNGIRKSSDRFWDKGGIWRYCTEAATCKSNVENQDSFRKSWNLAEFYVHLPWKWALGMGASLSHGSGQALIVETSCATKSCCELASWASRC